MNRTKLTAAEVLIAFPQVVVICFWELTKRDSPAEVVLAVTAVLSVLIILSWGALKVQKLARRSIKLHKNPAYILYSNLESLNKWGFLYIPFKATQYAFIIPILVHVLAKGLFVALGQNHGLVQAIGILILELVLLITLVVLRPYMDKKTNAFNVSIAAVNFVNAILLLFFTGVFRVHVSSQVMNYISTHLLTRSSLLRSALWAWCFSYSTASLLQSSYSVYSGLWSSASCPRIQRHDILRHWTTAVHSSSPKRIWYLNWMHLVRQPVVKRVEE